MLSFHNDPAIKAKYVARLEEHHRLDQIIQGTGYDGSRGCAVGCTLNNYSHENYETELGLPEWLAHLEDTLFEGIEKEAAPKFALDFLKAIPVGVDVENVKWQLAIWRNTKLIKGLEGNSEPYAQQCREAIQQVVIYCEGMLAETFDSESAARSAWSAAESAAESAARSARSAAWSAAWSAARSAAWSAESAAWSAARSAWSAAESAAESAAWSAWSAAGSAAWSAESAAYSEEAAMLLHLLSICG